MALSKRRSDSILKQMLQLTVAAKTPPADNLPPLQSSRIAQAEITVAQMPIMVRRLESEAICARRRIGLATILSNSSSCLLLIILCGESGLTDSRRLVLQPILGQAQLILFHGSSFNPFEQVVQPNPECCRFAGLKNARSKTVTSFLTGAGFVSRPP